MLELAITGIVAVTVITSLLLVLNHLKLYRADLTELQTLRADLIGDFLRQEEKFNQLLVTQAATNRKFVLEEVAEANRHLNALSEDFTTRLEGLQPENLANLNTRLTAVENLVSTHDLSLSLKRKSHV